MKPDFLMIIGPDGVGKTTLAQALSDKLGYTVTHFGVPKGHDEAKKEYFNFVEKTTDNVITDRFFEGEKIFAPLYRGYEANYFKVLEHEMKLYFNPLLILVNAPLSVIEERIKVRGEDFLLPEHFKYAYDKVIDIFNESTLPKMFVSTHESDVEQNVEKIIHKMSL